MLERYLTTLDDVDLDLSDSLDWGVGSDASRIHDAVSMLASPLVITPPSPPHISSARGRKESRGITTGSSVAFPIPFHTSTPISRKVGSLNPTMLSTAPMKHPSFIPPSKGSRNHSNAGIAADALLSIGPRTDCIMDRFNLEDNIIPHLWQMTKTCRSSRWVTTLQSESWGLEYKVARAMTDALISDLSTAHKHLPVKVRL